MDRLTTPGGALRYLRGGAGRTVVLLHTLRTQLEYFLPLIRELGAEFDVVVPDLPGHGQSAAPAVEYTAQYFTDTTEQFLEAAGLRDILLAGESIGASIALAIAGRRNFRVAGVVAINPYDYGRWGGIRRSSVLGNVLFTAMLWPGVGPIVARSDTKGILRRVMEGGLYDPHKFPAELLDELYRCGSLPGHARAFRSLCLNWRSWIRARTAYAGIRIPVTLVYGDEDWSRPDEREATARAIEGVRRVSLPNCGHFSCLDEPRHIARIIQEASCAGPA